MGPLCTPPHTHTFLSHPGPSLPLFILFSLFLSYLLLLEKTNKRFDVAVVHRLTFFFLFLDPCRPCCLVGFCPVVPKPEGEGKLTMPVTIFDCGVVLD